MRIDDLLARLNQLRTAGELKFLDQLPAGVSTAAPVEIEPLRPAPEFRLLPDRPLLKFHRTAGTVPARSLSARTPNRAAGQALLDSIADFCLPRNLFANFLAFRSKAHYNITYYYNLYTEQDQEDL